ncbi:unnamed protein product [Miscanthus lutarioriparius]|uniref:Uncharacterized protein n=1 Tax=Miscanthus lutarioriparius TaxID=422564 RepID=A0A811MPW8_9POAL|nr:unnamed protein product [Miscanthus lutarioriparius]
MDGVVGVQSGLVHGRVADEPPGVGERDAGRREEVALVVGDDLAMVVSPHGHARVRRPQVDADRRPVASRCRHLHVLRCEARNRCRCRPRRPPGVGETPGVSAAPAREYGGIG